MLAAGEDASCQRQGLEQYRRCRRNTVFVPGYTKSGPVCVTWGRKQQMTWAFMDKYCDETYAIFDQKNTLKKRRALDIAGINTFLSSLA